MTQLAFLIDPASDIEGRLDPVRQALQQTGHTLTAFADPGAALAQLAEGDATPALLLLSPRLERRLPLARQLHLAAPQAHILFLAEGPDPALEEQLRSPLALIGNHWSVVEPGAASFTAQLQEAARAARQRQQLRTTLNGINSRISEHQPADVSELRHYTHSDRFLASVLEHARDAIVGTNLTGAVMTWNQAAERLFGIAAADVLDKPLDSVAEGAWCELVPRLIEELVVAGRDVQRRELSCRRCDGRALEIELSASLVRDLSGAPVGISVIIRDILERKHAEAALRASEARYRTVAETASDGIITIDTESNILFINSAAERMFGYTASELQGAKLTTLMPAGLRERHRKGIERHATTQERHIPWSRVELPGLHKDGHDVPLEVSFGEFISDGKRLYTGILRDVTERREIEEQFRLAVEAAPNAMLMVDHRGMIVLANQQTEALFGYPRAELLQMSVEALIPSRFRDGHPELRSGYLAEPSARLMGASRDLYGLRKDGSEFPVEIGLTPIRAGETSLVLSTIIDNTLRKEFETTLRESNQRLEDSVAQRTSALTQANDNLERSNIELRRFAYIASHDLQSPLRSISGFLQLLQQDYAGQLDEQAHHWINRVVDNTNRMQTLIKDLLSYSRLESRARPFEVVDFNRVFGLVLEALESSIEESRANVAAGDLPEVHGDPSQLTQLLQNLIENAIKYNESSRPEVRVSAHRDGSHWLFAVRDNGIGIDAAHCEQVFEIFNRLHSQQTYPGTGIGLSVCRRIVERHGGRIWAESRPDGSEFVFTMPYRSPEN